MTDVIDALTQLRRRDPWSAHVLDAIATERLRQIEAEGWTPEHDDTHNTGEMAKAAGCYARVAAFQAREQALTGATEEPNAPVNMAVPRDWPWDDKWWKPKNAAQNLKRASALIVAEMARRLRAADAKFAAKDIQKAQSEKVST